MDNSTPARGAANETSAKRRRWSFRSLIRFRLRTLLIATALFAALLAWHLRNTQRQRQAVAEITEYGGWVQYDFQYPGGTVLGPNALVAATESPYPAWLIDQLGIDFFHNVVTVNLVYNDTSPGSSVDNRPKSPEILAELDNLPRTELLLMQREQVDDKYMQHVGKLRRLKGLYMWDASKLSDEGVGHLADCSLLEELHINSSQISDASLELIGGLPHMRRLTLQFHVFSDSGVRQLKGLRNLESLWLCTPDDRPSQLTDLSFKVFENFPKLTQLGIQNTAISAEQIEKFKASHPTCSVIHRVPGGR